MLVCAEMHVCLWVYFWHERKNTLTALKFCPLRPMGGVPKGTEMPGGWPVWKKAAEAATLHWAIWSLAPSHGGAVSHVLTSTEKITHTPPPPNTDNKAVACWTRKEPLVIHLESDWFFSPGKQVHFKNEKKERHASMVAVSSSQHALYLLFIMSKISICANQPN